MNLQNRLVATHTMTEQQLLTLHKGCRYYRELLNPIKIGKTVSDMVVNDQEAEDAAVRVYNDAIGLAHKVADQATADLLTQILKMEEGHSDRAEMQRAQIKQMGLENYLANQTAGAAS
jgi:bacterioferritin